MIQLNRLQIKKAARSLLIVFVLISTHAKPQEAFRASAEDESLGSAEAQLQEIFNTHYKGWYQIEVLIFEHKSTSNNPDVENWSKNITLTYPGNLVFLQTQPKPAPVAENQAEIIDNTLANQLPSLNNEENTFIQESDNLATAADDSETHEVNQVQKPGLEEFLKLEAPFTLLEREEISIDRDAQAFTSKVPYRELFYGAWRQPLSSVEANPNIVIFGGNRFDQHNELEGTIQISISRYLHLRTNLWFNRFIPNFGQQDLHWPTLPPQPEIAKVLPELSHRLTNDFTFSENQENDFSTEFNAQFEKAEEISNWANQDLSFLNQSQTLADDLTTQDTLKSGQQAVTTEIETDLYLTEEIIKIDSRRRMRSRELHYIDHPKVGILIKIIPYEPVFEEHLIALENTSTSNL